MSNLEKYIHTMPPKYHQWGDTYANPRCGFTGERVMPGSKLYFGFTVVMKPHVMDELHIHHGVEEYLIFTGTDMVNPFDFDAEIEIDMGEDPDHIERFTITEPTIIRIPEHLWHCPINFKRVGKPVNFIPLYYDGTWTRIMRRFTADGIPEFIFEGAGFRYCAIDKGKKCVYCGRCFEQKTEEREAGIK